MNEWNDDLPESRPSLSEALAQAAEAAWSTKPKLTPGLELDIAYKEHEIPFAIATKLKRKLGDLCQSSADESAWNYIAESAVLESHQSVQKSSETIRTREIVMTRIGNEIKPYFQRENYFVAINVLVVLKAIIWTFYDGTTQTLECEYDTLARPKKYIEKINREVIRTDTLVYEGDSLIERHSNVMQSIATRNVIGEILKVEKTPSEKAQLLGSKGFIDQFAVPNPRGIIYDARHIAFSAS